jgi:hypothetical protein
MAVLGASAFHAPRAVILTLAGFMFVTGLANAVLWWRHNHA